MLFDLPFISTPTVHEYGRVVAYRGGSRGRGGEGRRRRRAHPFDRRPFSIQVPHTGATRYDTTVAKIPAAALSIEDAKMLHRMQDRGEQVVVTLKMRAQTLPDAPSRNVVAELRGTREARRGRRARRPHRLVGRGQGAMDDGGCSVAAWDAVR